MKLSDIEVKVMPSMPSDAVLMVSPHGAVVIAGNNVVTLKRDANGLLFIDTEGASQ